MFGTEGHVVEERGERVSAFLTPGIHEARIASVEFMESRGGTPGIKFTFEGKPHGGDFAHPAGPQFKGSTAENTYWLSPKAWGYTKEKLIVMADKLGKRAELDAAKGTDAKSYTEAIAPLFIGLTARWKFAGQEIEGKVGEDGTKKPNWFKAELAGFGFVETISTSPSKLKFDEDNKYDMKRLPVAMEEPAGESPFGDAPATDDTW